MQKHTTMNFTIDKINIDIKAESNGIRLITENENWLLPNQTIDETKIIIEKNYKIVKNHFKKKIGEVINEIDIENVCLNIVLNFFQMYNHWRSMYEREKNRDLTFLDKDFEHPYTSHRIIDYFKRKYPDIYAEKCEWMLGMTSEEFKEYVLRKEQFDNK
jgi:hypothetical protein